MSYKIIQRELLYKQLLGQELSAEEKRYDKSYKEWDLLGETLNVVLYSNMTLIGKSLYTSLNAAGKQGLWEHLPAILGSTGSVLFGPQLITLTIEEILARTELTDKQKTLIKPWLNIVGRLALLEFIPKVHADDNGIYYQYPSTKGYTEVYSQGQTLIQEGEDITIKKPATLQTPDKKEYEGEYVAEFKLSKISQLTDEKLKIGLVNASGEKVHVEFRVNETKSGPKITVSSQDKELERQFTSYFMPQEEVQRFNSPVIEERVNSPLFDNQNKNFPFNLGKILSDSRFYSVAASFLVAGYIKGKNPTSASPLTSTALFLTLLGSLSTSVEAYGNDVGKNAGKQAVDMLNGVLIRANQDLQLTVLKVLQNTNEVITAKIQQVEGLKNEFFVDLKETGKILIREVGTQIEVSGEALKENLQLAFDYGEFKGIKMIVKAGEEFKNIFDLLLNKIELILEGGEKKIGRVIEKSTEHGKELIVSFGDQVQFSIKNLKKSLTDVTKKASKEGKVLINYAGEQFSLNIKEVGDEARKTIQEWQKVVIEPIPGVVGNATRALWDEIRYGWEVWRRGEIGRLLADVEKRCDEGTDKIETISSLLDHVREQNQLTISSSNKAELYSALISCIKKAHKNNDIKNMLFFLVAGVASLDEKLNNAYTSTNHVADVLAAIPNEKIRDQFKNNNYRVEAKKHEIVLKKDYSLTFSNNIFNTLSKLTGEKILIEQEAPVGSYLPYSSEFNPIGTKSLYLKCDGAAYDQEKYRELYDVIKHKYAKDANDRDALESRKKFRVPDLRGLFLRGFGGNKNDQFGQVYHDKTKLPKSIKITGGTHSHMTEKGGKHTHQVDSNGDHTHESSEEGEHEHQLTESGSHNHTLSNNCAHVHHVHDNGHHNHGMDQAGEHNHDNGDYKHLLQSDGHGTVTSFQGHAGRPNLVWMGPIKPAGTHTHTIHDGGTHTHDMDHNGDHTHEVTEEGKHSHQVSKQAPHSHQLISNGLHSHQMQIEGEHQHVILESGEHSHTLEGGDDETVPKHMMVTYLIKAKPSPFKEKLNQKIKKLRDEISSKEEASFTKILLVTAGGVVVTIVINLAILRYRAILKRWGII
jgi:hypothetical protein